MASSNDTEHVVDYLIHINESVFYGKDSHGNTALHLAVKGKHNHTVNLLLKAGEFQKKMNEMEMMNEDGDFPLNIAIRQENEKVCHLIYDYLVLLPTFIYSYKNLNFLRAKISISIVLYFWFGIRIYERIKIYIFDIQIITPSTISFLFNFTLILILYLMNLNIRSNSLLKFKSY